MMTPGQPLTGFKGSISHPNCIPYLGAKSCWSLDCCSISIFPDGTLVTLEKIGSAPVPFNNIKLNESIGFCVEGLQRNEVLIDGSWHDVLRMRLWLE